MSLRVAKLLLVVFLFRFSGAENSNLIQPFIVNGTDARIEDFPFMVSIRLRGRHNCGGTILNDYWMLTAAHCVAYLQPSDISVQYGLTNVSVVGENIVAAKQLIRHEQYSPSNQYINDIGLVEVATPLNMTVNGFQVKLPVMGSHFQTGTPATLLGWGSSSSVGPLMTTLQRVNLQVYSADDCRELHNEKIHFTNVCGGVPGGYKAQCSGDSGGPLLLGGSVQIGIVSWSVKPCGLPPYPGVLTAVSFYIGWIERHTGIDFQLNMSLQFHE